MHRIRVRREWLEAGALIEVEVPRNLRCATCEGGGCDVCDRSGAVTLRSREELPEIMQVTLPARGPKSAEAGGVTIRIPEQGGLPRTPEEPFRGFLLLSVVAAEEADPGVRLAQSPAPPSVELRPEADGMPVEPAQPQSGVRLVRRRSLAIPLTISVIVLWLAFLVFLRVTGRG